MKSNNSIKRKVYANTTLRNNNNFLDFVTICFSGEFPNLLLQARSLAKYGNDVVKEWTIVINSEIEAEEREKIFLSLQKELQDAQFNTFWIERKDIIDIGLPEMHGSRSQQILKIVISNYIQDKFYVLLDAKNHAIRPLEKEFFVRDGKPIVHREEYEAWNPFCQWFAKAFELVGLPQERALYQKYQSTTPYVMETEIVRECMNSDLLNSSKPWYYFVSLMGDKADSVTEFALYGAMFELFKKEAIFAPKNYVTLFAGYPSEHKHIMSFIERIKEDQIKFFGIHRSTHLSMDENISLALGWVSQGLFSSVENGVVFLKKGFVKDYYLPE
ncbi:hypothetical protein NBRC3280_1606 [Acetobacter pasteurianus NBRC 3280]|uniref:Uncharacterized protein n=2 Tax=Acetobacter pasteurianus TaxID=438 RepID=A0A401X426_ACEPA|nr:hypothetical protein NBRC3277_1681 [Acetobacter pasteurianus NBRC 3277]GCD62600.1 hypothetical protein NBRC3278_1693 [Acetobacter pasteurianus NBRC 3278]GCD68971.1 hypothetical protein NBRC3280_1606 [Acetobacter pasteurianus NBRC 3280]